MVIEIPAGLMDPGESAEQCAIRELKEETGYVGKVIEGSFGVSPVMFNGEYNLELWHRQLADMQHEQSNTSKSSLADDLQTPDFATRTSR